MNKKQKEMYDLLTERAEVALVVCGSGALYARGLSDKKPGDLDMCLTELSLHKIDKVMEEIGGKLVLDNPHAFGFTVRKQYSVDGEKYDFFTVGTMFNDFDFIEGIPYVNENIVWAARGFYAAMGSKKYQQQLVDQGYWTDLGGKKKFNLIGKIKWVVRNLLK